MLKPVYIARFQVTGPRGNPYMEGHASASLWVASRVDDEASLHTRVVTTLQQNGLTVVRGDRAESIIDDSLQPFEIRKLIRDARRNPDAVACGKFQGFEDHAGRRPMMLEVKTARLRLRPWEPRDRPPFAEMNADRDLMAFLPRHLTRAQSDEAIDQYLADFHKVGFGFLVAEKLGGTLAPNTFIGMMGLRIMRDILPRVQQPAVEIAWRIKREHQRQGFATEGGRALLKLAFEEFQLPEVNAVAAVANTAARGLMEKLGMKHRVDLDFNHPNFPAKHLYARHTLYQITNPN